MAGKGRVIRVGDRVVFRDKYKTVYTGTIEKFSPTGGTTTNVHLTDVEDVKGKPLGYGHVVQNTQVTHLDTPLAHSWLHPPQHLTMGQIVRVTLTGKDAAKTYGGLGNGDIGIVLQDKGDRVNVAKLGGAGRDTYARFTHSVLTVVPVAELSDWLPVATS